VEKTRSDEIQSLIAAIKFNRGEKVQNQREGQQMVDVAILTVLPEEFDAVKSQIPNLQKWSGADNTPSLYAWHTGLIPSKSNALPYKVALGMVGRSGNVNSAMAVRDALERWSPRYVFFVGIAGGLNESKKGDVTVADTIYGYDYGDVGKVFIPRMDWTYGTDQGLLTGITVYARSREWLTRIIGTPPQACTPKFDTGYIASGEKVVDDPTNEFFAAILKVWPRLTAVEMEGVGVATAITQAHALGKVVGYVMVRGISDVPRPESENGEKQGAKERENWKPYASAVAAALTVGYIADGLPVPPRPI
jgi:nucleoside phosphorylase